MSLKNNISKFNYCYGCGVCVAACPKKIISVIRNHDGFYSPAIEQHEKCINCGICLNVCAFNHDEISNEPNEIHGYASWSKDPLIRQWCSSGGIGFEIGRKLIEDGYEAVGVRYNPKKNRAEHFIAATVDDFMPSIGSKYIPSYTADAFQAINRKKKYFVTGAPCQIDSFRRYIRYFKIEDNFVLLDFFCHGVPSLFLWDKYILEIKKHIGEITFASWRNKTTGWHDSWSMNIDSEYDSVGMDSIDWLESYNLHIRRKKHSFVSRMSEGDLFYRFFLGDYCLNKCCYTTCKYKMCNSAADIRIGDLWGSKYSFDEKGVNAVLVLTKKGESILKELSPTCSIIPESISVVAEGQMKKAANRPFITNSVFRQLKSDKSLRIIFRNTVGPYEITKLPITLSSRAFNKMIKIISKQFR